MSYRFNEKEYNTMEKNCQLKKTTGLTVKPIYKDTPIGKQLRHFRRLKGMTINEMTALSGIHAGCIEGIEQRLT